MHDYNGKYERGIESIRTRIGQMPIPQGNRKAILRFGDTCFSEGISAGRVLKYLFTLANIARRLPKDFEKVTRADIEQVVADIERSDYSPWSKRDFRITLKKFFRWLRQTEENPPEVKWLRATVRNNHVKLPDEILTQDEVKRMIVAAPSAREKAFIAVLYESGCRIGEILPAQLRQFQPVKHGLQVTVTGKTGARRLLLISCAPYLTTWFNEHPKRDDPTAPVWPTSDYRTQYLSYGRVAAILKSVARRAGVRKAVNPHNFRHSRATHLAKYLTEAQMKEYFGWVQGSDMASVYVHLSGRDVDSALLRINNIPVDDDEKTMSEFSPKTCRHCGFQNPPTNKFCGQCSSVLDEKVEQEIVQRSLGRKTADEIMDRMLDDETFRAAFERRLTEITKADPRPRSPPSPTVHRHDARPLSTAA